MQVKWPTFINMVRHKRSYIFWLTRVNSIRLSHYSGEYVTILLKTYQQIVLTYTECLLHFKFQSYIVMVKNIASLNYELFFIHQIRWEILFSELQFSLALCTSTMFLCNWGQMSKTTYINCCLQIWCKYNHTRMYSLYLYLRVLNNLIYIYCMYWFNSFHWSRVMYVYIFIYLKVYYKKHLSFWRN